MAELVDQNERNNEFNLFSVLKDTFVVFIWLGYFFILIAFATPYLNRPLYAISQDTFYFPLYRWLFPTENIFPLPFKFKLFLRFMNVFSTFLITSVFSIVGIVCLKKVFAFYSSDFFYARNNEKIFDLALTVIKKALWPIVVMTIYYVIFNYLRNYIWLWLFGKEQAIYRWLANSVRFRFSNRVYTMYNPFSQILGFLFRWFYDIPFLLVFICYDMNISSHSDIIECFKKITKGIFLKAIGIIFLINLFSYLIMPPFFVLIYHSFRLEVLLDVVPSVISVIAGGFYYAYMSVMYLKMRNHALANGFSFIPRSMWKYQKKQMTKRRMGFLKDR